MAYQWWIMVNKGICLHNTHFTVYVYGCTFTPAWDTQVCLDNWYNTCMYHMSTNICRWLAKCLLQFLLEHGYHPIPSPSSPINDNDDNYNHKDWRHLDLAAKDPEKRGAAPKVPGTLSIQRGPWPWPSLCIPKNSEWLEIIGYIGDHCSHTILWYGSTGLWRFWS